MVKIKSAAQLANQIAKAKQLKPRVRFISLRNYEVQSESAPHLWHHVRFAYVAGERLADCSCPAGQRDRACYHVCSVVLHHVQKMTEIRDAQQAERRAA